MGRGVPCLMSVLCPVVRGVSVPIVLTKPSGSRLTVRTFLATFWARLLSSASQALAENSKNCILVRTYYGGLRMKDAAFDDTVVAHKELEQVQCFMGKLANRSSTIRLINSISC